MFLHYNTRPRRACCLSLSFNKSGENLARSSKAREEAGRHQNKHEGFQGKGKGEDEEKRKHPLSEGAGTAGKAQRGNGVGRACAGGGGVEKGRAKCPHNREQIACYRKKQVQAMQRGEHLRAQPQKSTCKQCCAASTNMFARTPWNLRMS